MSTTFTISGSVLFKAGEGVNASLKDGGDLFLVDGDYIVDRWINEAEAVICDACRYDFLTAYPSLTSGAKLILSETAANMAAINAIAYDMGGYTSRTEAEDMINALDAAAKRNISILRDKPTQKYIVDPTTGTV